MIIVGIDPGVTGALAIFGAGRLAGVVDMPVNDGRVNGSAIASWFLRWKPQVVYLEWTQPMPKNGSIASYSLGLNSGIVIGVVQALSIPLERVRPNAWKKAMGLTGKPKAASRGMATELFPEYADQFRRVKDDGRAEAALIARYGAYVNIQQAQTGRDENEESATVSDLRRARPPATEPVH
jgi:crossover junction endodeoxyribonuclease RuvC